MYSMFLEMMKRVFPKEMMRIFPREIPRPLGRWKMETCRIKMDQKIDLSNEDHCGPCGQYRIEKRPK